MKAPGHHLVGDFVAYALELCTSWIFQDNPAIDTFIAVKSCILIFGLQNMIALVIGEPVLCEVTLGTNFSWVVSKMPLSSTKLYAK